MRTHSVPCRPALHATPINRFVPVCTTGALLCASVFWWPTAHAATDLAANAVITPTAHAQAYSRAAHDALMHSARQRSTSWSDVLQRLDQWFGDATTTDLCQRLAADGVIIARLAGQDEQAVHWARLGPIGQLPAYALFDAAYAARAVGARDIQAQAVQRLRVREPAAWQPRILEALWLTDAGAYARAGAALDATERQWRSPTRVQRIALLEARGALAEARGLPLEALGAYEDLLAMQPDHAYARFAVADALARHAATRAQAYATDVNTRHPGAFDAKQQARLSQAALGQRLRWAGTESAQRAGEGRERYGALLALLPQFDRDIAAAQASGWRLIELALRYDRLAAWRQLGHDRAVIDEYHALLAQNADLPYYALADVAGAYQRQRRSDLAVPLYEQAIALAGSALTMPSDTHVGLVYAYIDTARFEQGEQLLRQLETATPAYLRRSPTPGQANPQYGEVRHLRARIQLYTDHPAQAERSFEALTAMAPLNPGFGVGRAETAQAREHPQAALDQVEALRTDHPHDPEVEAAYARALIGAGYLKEGRARTQALIETAPTSQATHDAQRELMIQGSPRLDIDAGAGRQGAALANRDWRVDTHLRSGLIDDQWRVFARHVEARGETDPDSIRLGRSGVGIEWLAGPWLVSGEAHRANRGPYRGGVAAQVNYRASDQWRLSASLDSNSINTPYKARRDDIGAREASVGARYVVDEARSFSTDAARMNYSDGNARQSVGLQWQERWISGGRWRVDSTVGVETARGDRQDVPYFSPDRETAGRIGVRTEYLTWKRDHRRMAQVLETDLGHYRQAGYGAAGTWALAYSHEWTLDAGWQFSYGIGIARQPYDGVDETRRHLFLNVSIPFQP